jgi:hypothetical protein
MRIVVLSWLLSIASMSYGQLPNQPSQKADASNHQSAPKKTEEATTSPLLRVEGQITTSKSKLDSAEEGKENADKATREKWSIGIATLAFLVACGALYIAARQLGMFRRQLELTEQTIRDGNEAAKRQMRAYLVVHEAVIRLLPTGLMQAVVVLKNTGKSPAHMVRRALLVGFGSGSGKIQNLDTAGGFYDGFPIERTHGQMPLAPDGLWEIRQVLWLLNANVWGTIATNSNQDVYVWGRAEYMDIYGEPQVLNYRFKTAELIMGGNGFIAGWALHPTEDGNDAS